MKKRKQGRELNEIQKLKEENRRLRRENRSLQKRLHSSKSEVKTFKKAFDLTVDELEEYTKDLSVEEIISSVNKGKALDKLARQQHREDKALSENKIEDRWRCHDCGRGVLKIVIISRQDGAFYFRRCSELNCNKRTKLQRYNDTVKGIK